MSLTPSAASPAPPRTVAGPTATRVRWLVLAMLFTVTTINYADRATLSIAGADIRKAFDLSPVQMGYIFSAFAWSYVLAQLPGGWLLDRFGSKTTYFFGLTLWSLFTLFQGTVGFLTVIYGPRAHPWVNQAEIDYIQAGGALVDLDGRETAARPPAVDTFACIKELLGNRLLLGLYVFQYCINVLTYFFLTWFPVYLVSERHMTILKAGLVASLPAICGFVGGVLGGWASDRLIKAGWSLSAARKTPIVVGMLLAMSMIGCNYATSDALVVGFMSLAFFGKGVGALGWAVVSDTSPRQAGGLSGALFNTFGNTAGITTPIVIGYILQTTGSFAGALTFVGVSAAVALLSMLLLVGDIHRVELKKSLLPGAGA
jgi:ACS family glucarate transporter-like MFS transporter